MSDSYELDTISDLMKIPPDRLGACLRDIEYAIQMAHFVVGSEKLPDIGGFTWTDDGDHSVNVSLNGEPWCSLEVTENP